MNNELLISRLDELIGDFDTPFFNYLIYSYDLDLNDCELIIDDIRYDLKTRDMDCDNLVLLIDSYFKAKIIENEKDEKIELLSSLLDEDSEFFIKFLEEYGLDEDEISLIFDKVKSKIISDNITDFEIRRHLKYYFSNAVKQTAYLRDLDNLVGRNYDTLIIKSTCRKYPNLRRADIIQIAFNIHSQILDAKEFSKGIKQEFMNEAMKRSEAKKAEAKVNLGKFVDDSGDSFLKLIHSKGLTKKDGEIIVDEIVEDINSGLIQPDDVDSVFITNRFNEYCEYEGQ